MEGWHVKERWCQPMISNVYPHDDLSVSLLAVDQYRREVKGLEHLSKEQEQVMLQRLARANADPYNPWLARLAQEARVCLVEQYLPMVLSLVKKVHVRESGMEWLDVVQEGNVHLLGALDTYDIDRGASFFTWAYFRVSMGLRDVLREKSGCVHLPAQKRAEMKRLTTVEQRLFPLLRREPSVADVAQEMQVTEERIHELRVWREYEHVQSIQALLVEEDAEDRYRLESLYQPEISLEDMVVGQEMYWYLCRVMSVLPARTCEILRLFSGLDGDDRFSSREIAQRLGMKRSAVTEALRRGRKVLQERFAVLDHEGVAS